jgi:hypothetical protein
VSRQTVYPHPAVNDWVRRTDDQHFGVAASFNRACEALGEIDLDSCGAVIRSDRCRLYNYVPLRAVPGAYRMILMFDIEGPYVNILSVAIPVLTLSYHAPAIR